MIGAVKKIEKLKATNLLWCNEVYLMYFSFFSVQKERLENKAFNTIPNG